MKRTIEFLMCLGILCGASTCFSQITYKATDLGALPGGHDSVARAVNDTGRIVGEDHTGVNPVAILWDQAGTAPRTIVPASYNPLWSTVAGINNSGQVVGSFNGGVYLYDSNTGAFKTFENVLPTEEPTGINQQGTMVGLDGAGVAFTYNVATGLLALYPGPGGYFLESRAYGINDSGDLAGVVGLRSFRFSPAIYNAATSSWILFPVPVPAAAIDGALEAINDDGWAVGWWEESFVTGFPLVVRKDGSTINLTPPADTSIFLFAVNNAGLAVGFDSNSGAYAYDIPTDTWMDLSTKVVNPGVISLGSAAGISSNGKIVGSGIVSLPSGGQEQHGFLLTPIIPYKAFVQPPIDADGSSEFNAKRGAVPVKFTLTKDDKPTCNLPPATISVTRTTGESAGFIDASAYKSYADKAGSSFAIAACQYTYILQTKALGEGNYRVDINIEGQVVGSAKFALQ